MGTQGSDVIDLTLQSSPEVSPLAARRASHAGASPSGRSKRAGASPHQRLPPPDRVPTCSPSEELIDLPVRQSQRPKPPLPPPSLPPTRDNSQYANFDENGSEWRPSQAGPCSQACDSEGGQPPAAGRKPKRTREQIAADAAERKAAKAQETAVRKQQREYDSDKHVLRYVTAVLDPLLMTTELGLKIADGFRQTQRLAEHERIAYVVAPTGLEGFPAIKWRRKIPSQTPTAAAGLGLASHPSQSTAPPDIAFEEREEPHVMVCFEAAAFIEAVQTDRLASLWRQLEARCSGQRVHLMVHRLEGHLTARERREFQESMRTGAGGGAFRRGDIDAFVAALAVQRPGVTFRDVRLVDEGASHACLVTHTIAKAVLRKSVRNIILSPYVLIFVEWVRHTCMHDARCHPPYIMCRRRILTWQPRAGRTPPAPPPCSPPTP
jgi:hypothetical protein